MSTNVTLKSMNDTEMTLSLKSAGGVIALSLIDVGYTRDAHHQETPHPPDC